MRHLGVLAHSAEGAADCLRRFCARGADELGEHLHPDVTLDCIAFGHAMRAWADRDHGSVRTLLATSVERLAAAGADFFVCPDNTAHLALEHAGPDLALPGLHLPDVVAEAAARRGARRVGVLGTRFTMSSSLYPQALAAVGIDAVVPDEASQAVVDGAIFSELVHGRFLDGTRRRFLDVITGLADQGCDAVALACTEIPLLVSADESPLPVLDSTGLLADAAFEVAVGGAALPTWRGGAVTDG